MKSITAIAIVKKLRPTIKVNELYTKLDAKDVKIEKDEMKVEVIIKKK